MPIVSCKSTPNTSRRVSVAAICLGLCLAVLGVFGWTVRYGFVYDDFQYLHANPPVKAGLSVEGITNAFTSTYASNWHPLTWISHMLDCQWYGLNPAGHHLTSVLLHAATAVLLFLALLQMTGARWPAALAAALFAIHPLRAESVAWVAERKDVLSGLFFVLTLAAYAHYAKHPFSLRRYLLLAGLFALGLMAKPMLVTLPLLLLLLDYWPLERFRSPAVPPENSDRAAAQRRLWLEKIPLLLLTTASCITTLVVQRSAIHSGEELPLGMRIGNALVSYVTYLAKFVCPVRLAVLYPFPLGGPPAWQVAGTSLLLIGITAAVFYGRRRRSYLLVGWLWYLMMMVPVIGLVQVGTQALADRYTYLPQIGLAIMVAWGVADLCAGRPHWRPVVVATAVVVLALLLGCARLQTSYWRDSETLWNHTLACTSQNAYAHNNLGVALFDQHRYEDSRMQFQQAVDINPQYVEGHSNLGNALRELGRMDEAIAHIQQALALRPNSLEGHNSLGLTLQRQGQMDEAVRQYRRALEIEPQYADAHYNLAGALYKQGKAEEAIGHYRQAVAVKPEWAEAQNNLGLILMQTGQDEEAATHLRCALAIRPGYDLAQSNLAQLLSRQGQVLYRQGRPREALAQWQESLRLQPDALGVLCLTAWVLATNQDPAVRNGGAALALAQRAAQLSGTHPEVLDVLAAACAETGRFAEAITIAQQAATQAANQRDQQLAQAIQTRIKGYQASAPFRETRPRE